MRLPCIPDRAAANLGAYGGGACRTRHRQSQLPVCQASRAESASHAARQDPIPAVLLPLRSGARLNTHGILLFFLFLPVPAGDGRF